MTKEHIWPKCIIDRMPELETKYLKSRNLFTPSDLVIKDVCADCNNKKLSTLDSYFCSLYDNYFKTFKEDASPFVFKYDYDLLLRSLLKITYNSSRTVNRDRNDFEKYQQVILEGNIIRQDIVVKLDIIQPTLINNQKMYPSSARCGVVQLPEENPNFLLRVVSVNSYYFHLILSKSLIISSEMHDEFYRVFESVPGTLIQPYKFETLVDTFSGYDTQNSHIDFIESTKNLYNDYKDRTSK